MMVNETAVTLIEQCVRLHIFASHRLCELNFNEFDQKMNTGTSLLFVRLSSFFLSIQIQFLYF